jgi:TldD protein
LERAADLAAKVLGSDEVEPATVNLTPCQSGCQLEYQRMPDQVAFDEKIAHVLAANQAARKMDDEIRQVTLALSDVQRKLQIANSEGDLVEEEQVRVRMVVNAIAARDGMIQTGYESAGGTLGWELLEQISLEDMAREAASRAVAMLSAVPAPLGKMPVVMHADAGGTMVHEACGHGLEADLVQKGLSIYKDKMGDQVAIDGLSVIDDATIKGKYGSFAYDDEGTPGKRTVMIDRGILKKFMNDRLTACNDGSSLTGNGRRESYQHKPIPRMTNTFIASGEDDPHDIIADTEYGLLVRKMGGGQVNTINGDFVFDVQEGYIIRHGEIEYPVRGAILTGNGPQALLDIDRIGKDLGYSLGVCGKDGQGVPVGDAQPTIRIKALTVGGTGSDDSAKTIKRIRRI